MKATYDAIAMICDHRSDKKIIDVHQNEEVATPHKKSAQRRTEGSQRRTEMEKIERIANMYSHGVPDYQANLARWKASEERRMRNIEILDSLARSGIVPTRPASCTISSEMMANYLLARQLLLTSSPDLHSSESQPGHESIRQPSKPVEIPKH